MIMPNRSFQSNRYSRGYNKGSEKDDDISGEGNHFTTFYREGDTRLLTWWSVDPKTDDANSLTPYSYMDDNPIEYNDPNGDCPTCFIGAILGAAVEYGSQVAANLYEGKNLKSSLTDIDVGDVFISAGEGFVTSGTSTYKTVLVKVGAEYVKNKYDVKAADGKLQLTTNDTKTALRNTVVGLSAAGAAKVIPIPKKIKLKPEIKPAEAVKAARKKGTVNRSAKKKIKLEASEKLKTDKAINNAANELPIGIGIGGTTEVKKRKGDKNDGF
jgi:hypothetical protein